jgi:hypothetical protein
MHQQFARTKIQTWRLVSENQFFLCISETFLIISYLILDSVLEDAGFSILIQH